MGCRITVGQWRHPYSSRSRALIGIRVNYSSREAVLKISSISPGDIGRHSPHHPGNAWPATLRHALQFLRLTLERMGTAIALGEAGDLDGAQALRERHGK